jgi:CelD/BcsL family acetyltransferase involved in cellulose biosynthesis
VASLEAAASRPAPTPAEPSHAPAPRVEAHATLAELATLAAPWRELEAQPRVRSPFRGFDWNRAWAELYGGDGQRLHVVSVRRGSELIGIAPFVVSEPPRRSQPRRIAFLGADRTACDQLDVLCAEGEERAVASALMAHLFGPRAPRWHRLDLQGFPADSAFLFHFRECFEAAGKHVEVGAGAYCPTRRLIPGGVLESLPVRRQKRLRYERHALERAGQLVHETWSARQAEFPEALATVAELYRRRWSGERDALRCVEAYARGAGQSAALRVDLLRLDARPLAGLVQLRQHDALYLYLLAVDREAFPKLSVGNLLIALTLERAAGEGIRSYDFLRGGEDYKFLWSDGAERCLDFTAYRPGAALLAQLALARVRELVKIAWR